jgi:hypothetical protein
MNPRLINLLGSFIGGTSDYTLARLEFAMTFPERPAPPVLDRLPDASERTLRERWDTIEAQLHASVAFVRAISADPAAPERLDAAFRWLDRTIRELDQYARAMRWVLTVSDYDRE